MTHRALIVDDNHDVREVVSEIVESHGHDHRCAESKEQAEALLAQEAFSYVLLDLEIPLRAARSLSRVENGYLLLEFIRARFSPTELPILVMTAHGTGHEYCRRALLKGANNFIKKPFSDDSESLDDMIRGVVAAHASKLPAQSPTPPTDPAAGLAPPPPTQTDSEQRQVDSRTPLKAQRWADCVVVVGAGVTIATRSGARRPVKAGRAIRRDLESLMLLAQCGGTDLGVADSAKRRARARRVSDWIRKHFHVAEAAKPLLSDGGGRYLPLLVIRSGEEDATRLKPLSPTTPSLQGECRSCGEGVRPWACGECEQEVEDRCSECHIEAVHERLS